MSGKNIHDEFEELKKMLLFEEPTNDYTELLDKLGLDMKTLEENSFSTVELEYKSETGKELSYVYPTDSGFDLYSSEDIVIEKFGRALVPTGISFEIPKDFEIQIRPKSGLALNHGLTVLNTPGTVDEGYRGEVKVIVFNTNPEQYKITKGMKIAQAVIARCITGRWVILEKVEKLKSADRGDNGFGSTGI